MTRINGNIKLSGNLFNYYQYGNGKELMIAFHGFYQDATSFEYLFSFLGEKYTIISIDLPHHGKSKFHNEFFEVENVKELIDCVLHKFKFNQFNLFGYSLGGRVALKYLESYANQIKNLVLCAPDGFYLDKWYAMSTKSFVGKYFFKRFTERPKTLIKLIEKMGKYNLISHRLLRFAKNNINDQNAFNQVAKVWPSMSRLQPNLRKISQVFSKMNINCLIFVGKFDVVVRPGPTILFSKKIKAIKLFQLDTGHSFTNDRVQLKIAEIINANLC